MCGRRRRSAVRIGGPRVRRLVVRAVGHVRLGRALLELEAQRRARREAGVADRGVSKWSLSKATQNQNEERQYRDKTCVDFGCDERGVASKRAKKRDIRRYANDVIVF